MEHMTQAGGSYSTSARVAQLSKIVHCHCALPIFVSNTLPRRTTLRNGVS